jgi:hypothetical protein
VLVCYLSAGSWEDWRPDAKSFPRTAIGEPLRGWPGERWLDVMDAEVRDALVARLDLAAHKGCDAVDPDNVDGWTTQTGFPITPDEEADYLRFLADAAHTRGLAFGLKNDPTQLDDLLPWLDFAVVEACGRYDECYLWKPLADAGLGGVDVEYAGDDEDLEAAAARLCPVVPAGIDVLVKHLDLGPSRASCVTRAGFERAP